MNGAEVTDRQKQFPGIKQNLKGAIPGRQLSCCGAAIRLLFLHRNHAFRFTAGAT
jgi:hypothetical protein